MDENNFGLRFQEERTALGLSVEALARKTLLSVRQIENLEAGRFQTFGAYVYAYGSVKRLAHELLPMEADKICADFRDQWEAGIHHASTGKNHARLWGNRTQGIFGVRFRAFLPKAATFAGACAVLVLLAASVRGFLSPPELTLAEPIDGLHLTAGLVHLAGSAQKESQLTVNGKEILISETGAFAAELALQPGFTTLEFLVENRFGKTTTVYRRIFVE